MKKLIHLPLIMSLVFSLFSIEAHASGISVVAKAVETISKQSVWSQFSKLARTTPAAGGLSDSALLSNWQNNPQLQRLVLDEVRTYYPNYTYELLEYSGELTSNELAQFKTLPTGYEVANGGSITEKIDRLAAQHALEVGPPGWLQARQLSHEEFVKQVNRVLEKRAPDCRIEFCAAFGGSVVASFGAGCGEFSGSISTTGTFSIIGAQGRSIVFQLADSK